MLDVQYLKSVLLDQLQLLGEHTMVVWEVAPLRDLELLGQNALHQYRVSLLRRDSLLILFLQSWDDVLLPDFFASGRVEHPHAVPERRLLIGRLASLEFSEVGLRLRSKRSVNQVRDRRRHELVAHQLEFQ